MIEYHNPWYLMYCVRCHVPISVDCCSLCLYLCFSKYLFIVLNCPGNWWLINYYHYLSTVHFSYNCFPSLILIISSMVQGDELQVKVNKLSSTKTQLPYDYYFLKYCTPHKILNSAENLGEVLRGDRIENSVYTVSPSKPSINHMQAELKFNFFP